MARSYINDTANNLVNDSGSVLVAIVKGEQLHVEVALGWLTSLTDYNIHARLVEAVNDGAGGKPQEVKIGGIKRLLTKANGYIIDMDESDNKFTIVFPYDIAVGAVPQPAPAAPIFFFLDVEVGEPGTGDTDPVGDAALPNAQIWKPVRGLVQVMYSPTED